MQEAHICFKGELKISSNLSKRLVPSSEKAERGAEPGAPPERETLARIRLVSFSLESQRRKYVKRKN